MVSSKSINHFLYYLGYMLISLVVQALVLIKLWAWFVSPTFSVPELNFATSFGLLLGLLLVVSLVTSRKSEVTAVLDEPEEADRDKPAGTFNTVLRLSWLVFSSLFLRPLVLLLLGWITYKIL